MKYLLYSVSAWALATSAMAQDAPRAAPGGAGDSIGLSEVIVTAARRAEDVQRAALSIQALSSDALTKGNITNPEDLNSIAPGVSIAATGAVPQVYVRGVGNYSANSYAEAAVAFNLDGVYISRPWASRGMFYDLERVEVLKGPQGTLYGRNASGGAINIITVQPKLGETSGFAELQVGNYNLVQGTAAVNVPLGDTLALRASARLTRRDGYLSDGYDDDETDSARLQLLWEPTDDLSILLRGQYQHTGGKGGGAVLNPPLPGDEFRGAADPAVGAIIRAQPGTGALLRFPDQSGYTDIDVYAIGAELNWDLGFGTLTVLPAYRDAKWQANTLVPGFPYITSEHDKQTSVEARLGGESEKLKWVVGGFYFNEEQSNFDGKPLQVALQGINAQQTPQFDLRTISYAAFSQATYALTDALRLTGGLRYTYERRTLRGLTQTFAPRAGPACAANRVFDPATPSAPLFCRLDIPLDGRLTYNNVTYKVGVEYDLAPQSMAYASVSTGFKSGSFYNAPRPNTFRPEKITAFEAGVKNRFLDNRLQVNVEGFYYNYKDHQEAHFGPTSQPGLFTFITENAGSAVSYGADLDVVYLLTPQDEFSLKVQYNKAKYDTFVYGHPTAVLGPPVNGCLVGPVVAGSQSVNCNDKQLVRAPTWSGVVSYQHTFDVAGGSLVAGADVQFASSHYVSIDFLPTTRQKSYAVGNVDLTYTPEGGRWSLGGYVNNIWEERVITQAARYPFVTPANPLADPTGLILASVRAPRTYGARLRVNF